MIFDEKKIKNCKILSIRYKIVKRNLQVLQWFMYTLVKREFDIYNILIIQIKSNIKIVDNIY